MPTVPAILTPADWAPPRSARCPPTTAGETCTLVDDACPAGCTRVPSEVEEWGAAAVRAWAGYTMVKCTENDNVVRRCDGVNDCAGGGGCTLADDGGAGVTSTCSSDEMDCGGLIGQVQANTVLDPTVEPTVATTPWL